MFVPPDAPIALAPALAPFGLVEPPASLPVSALRRGCDPASLPFETTAELPPPEMGQVDILPVIFMPSFSDGGLWYQADLRRWRRRRDRNGKRRRRGSRP